MLDENEQIKDPRGTGDKVSICTRDIYTTFDEFRYAILART